MKAGSERAYRRTLTGLSAIVHLLVIVLVAVLLIYLGRTAYRFGYSIFHETGVQNPPGTDVTVVIPDGASVEEIAEILEKNGLITDTRVFRVQERLSDYHGEMTGGVYTLNTSETPTEIIATLAGDPPQDETESDA